jgi:hypothetical protein
MKPAVVLIVLLENPTLLKVLAFHHAKIVKQDSPASLVQLVSIVKLDSRASLVHSVKSAKQDSLSLVQLAKIVKQASSASLEHQAASTMSAIVKMLWV